MPFDERPETLRSVREAILAKMAEDNETGERSVTLSLDTWRTLLAMIRKLEKDLDPHPQHKGPYTVSSFGQFGKILEIEDRTTSGLALRRAKELSMYARVVRVEISDYEGNLEGTVVKGVFREAGYRPSHDYDSSAPSEGSESSFVVDEVGDS